MPDLKLENFLAALRMHEIGHQRVAGHRGNLPSQQMAHQLVFESTAQLSILGDAQSDDFFDLRSSARGRIPLGDDLDGEAAVSQGALSSSRAMTAKYRCLIPLCSPTGPRP
jgi:hypothetical protein